MTLSAVLEGQERWHIENADVMSGLRLLPDESVHCVVTSPPYWGLRTYSTNPQVWGGDGACGHEWGDPLKAGEGYSEGNRKKWQHGHSRDTEPEAWQKEIVKGAFCTICGAWRGELGLEPTPELFIEHMVEVFREVWRVLRRDGTLWLNLGDSYVAGPTGHQDISSANGKAAQMFAKGGRYRVDNMRKDTGRHFGHLKPKDLCMMPARVALALQADGWYLRSEITWCKKAPMPESVKDRPTSATEKIYLLTKSPRYYFDMEAVREPLSPFTQPQRNGGGHNNLDASTMRNDLSRLGGGSLMPSSSAGRNLWNYWLLGPEPFPMAHFATFPTEIPRRCILAGTSAHGVCGTCGAPWRRVVERGELVPVNPHDTHGTMGNKQPQVTNWDNTFKPRHHYEQLHKGWQPTCTHAEAPVVGAVVLDPFAGSGTTLMVALRHGRRAVGLELSAEYTRMARERIINDAPLFNMREVG